MMLNLEIAPIRTEFTTTTRGINRESPPYRLFEKAKRLGIWNASDIDFCQDQADWPTLTDGQREWVIGIGSAFIAGEEAVTLDLLPLIRAVAQEGHLEEEMFLTTFLFEEAKHIDFFDRFFRQVVGPVDNLSQYHDPDYSHIFYHALPEAMQMLEMDPSPVTLARASVIYNMIIEGVLAEAGFFNWFRALKGNNVLPGMVSGIELIKRDESRHIAYGTFLLSRLIATHDDVWPAVEATFAEMRPYVVIEGPPPEEHHPFGIDFQPFRELRLSLFEKRFNYLKRMRGTTLMSIYERTTQAVEQDQEVETM